MKSNLLTILTLIFPVLGQTTVKDALVQHSKTSVNFTVAVASSMPAGSYNFRPDQEEMTFGQLMRHIAAVNLDACGYASGMTRPALPPKIAELDKDKGNVDVERSGLYRVCSAAARGNRMLFSKWMCWCRSPSSSISAAKSARYVLHASSGM
jgi:hypothetical protein